MYAIQMLRRLRSDKRGATAIEYGLIVSLICIAVIGGMEAMGGGSNGMWGKLEKHVTDNM